ncbi:hypothetical protein PVAP13_1KG260000 [Panicum virgatum]|uniref:Uncharacterized protein n=1 Tax=Panicum virgatum TaxID=38727 RepID=A0A8T0XDP9_PANVG|nr:hypothetical protein PVAP13_1KG260000 [Panicum virgatum]KAG2658170.1 hypothetical protein PVAP13_1KG260000 [Panicum virgatum]
MWRPCARRELQNFAAFRSQNVQPPHPNLSPTQNPKPAAAPSTKPIRPYLRRPPGPTSAATGPCMCRPHLTNPGAGPCLRRRQSTSASTGRVYAGRRALLLPAPDPASASRRALLPPPPDPTSRPATGVLGPASSSCPKSVELPLSSQALHYFLSC